MSKIYYELEKKELEQINTPKKLLLHSCCAPCSSHVISLLTNYFDITILYYNPNISPIEEYQKRKEEQIKLIKSIPTINKINIINCDYDNEIYNEKIKGFENCPERGARCQICYKLRLEKAAIIAKKERHEKERYDYFCTTLSVSPYKNSIIINQIGEQLSNKYNIKWLYSDFKKNDGYKKSIELSKKYNLYRQNYCGCIYSQNKEIID